VLQTETQFVTLAQRDQLPSGSVVLAVMLSGKELYVANVGDSRAVLCKAGKAVPLTTDHTPSLQSERDRIKIAGGTIEDGRVGGLLTVSRAVGGLTDDGKKVPGMTAMPELKKYFISDEDEFIVLGCDGVFEQMDDDYVISFARRSLLRDNDVQKTSHDLVVEGLRCRSSDNVTALVIGFSKIDPNGQLYIVRDGPEPRVKEPKQRRPIRIARDSIAALHRDLDLPSPAPPIPRPLLERSVSLPDLSISSKISAIAPSLLLSWDRLHASASLPPRLDSPELLLPVSSSACSSSLAVPASAATGGKYIPPWKRRQIPMEELPVTIPPPEKKPMQPQRQLHCDSDDSD